MGVPMQYLNINCLVVDDEASMRRTINNMMQKLGFKSVVMAESGKKALDIIKSVKIDLVISDINMPEVSGTEFFTAVRKDKKYDRVNFIFVTAEANKSAVAKAAESGADDYLIKPFVLANLEAKLSKVLAKKFNPSNFDTHLRDFKRYLDERDLSEAENQLLRASEYYPDSPTVAYNFGLLAVAKGDAYTAINFFKKAIEKKPMFVNSYNSLAEVYENLGDMESAIKYYEMAREISPASTERLIALSKIYTTKGETDKAETILKDAISGTREGVSASSHLMGQMYLAKNENEKALEMLIKAYKKNPYDPSILQSLAEAYRKVAKHEQAIEIYKEALKVIPNDAHIKYQMGKTYLEMGNKQKAIDAIKAAWEINPFSKSITNDLRALAETDKFDI
ncbi:MAG: response regulator [Nitrospirae bacterium]|nr:response regulator [Nitrospirota bacterium]